MKNCESGISQLDFRREIVQTYLATYRCLPRGQKVEEDHKSARVEDVF